MSNLLAVIDLSPITDLIGETATNVLLGFTVVAASAIGAMAFLWAGSRLASFFKWFKF